ncbi:Methyltransferase domain [Actinobacteria bacterium IMCC26207]|nr:Methyltransferase domain [Actinobacteria bacterium IMCC26207]
MSYQFGLAYEFSSTEEHRAHYDKNAELYDEEFAQVKNYDYPARVAAVLKSVAVASDSPIADVGCGTGLVGRSLAQMTPEMIIDGLDLSPGMLRVAVSTGTYRAVHEVDLTQANPNLEGLFGSVISTGTFTLGHLGPSSLQHVIALGRPHALFVLAINQKHFLAENFAAEFNLLQDAGKIGPWEMLRVPIYSEPLPQEEERTGCVVVFRRHT